MRRVMVYRFYFLRCRADHCRSLLCVWSTGYFSRHETNKQTHFLVQDNAEMSHYDENKPARGRSHYTRRKGEENTAPIFSLGSHSLKNSCVVKSQLNFIAHPFQHPYRFYLLDLQCTPANCVIHNDGKF
jgi:hypothetical protein